MTSEKDSCKNSRWRSPTSWILKNCCQFIIYWPIIVKLCATIATLIWSLSMTSEMQLQTFKMAVATILNFEKVCHYFSTWPISSPNLVETLRLRFRTHRLHWKFIIAKIQNYGRLHSNFRKTVVISLLFDLTMLNLVGILVTSTWEINMAFAAILTFEKMFLFLYHLTEYRQI